MIIERKIAFEKEVVTKMIRIYCRKNHNTLKNVCDKCTELINYACLKIDNCHQIETKNFCSFCKIHCFKREYKDNIKKVMRFSGPRLIFSYPILVFRYVYTDYYRSRIEIKEDNHNI